MNRLPLVVLLLLCARPGYSLEPTVEELVLINQALRDWLRLMETDRLHLVVDRQAREVRLQHGRAVLRNCPVRVDSLGGGALALAELRLHLRRYRPSDPWSPITRGPFDWEQVLAEQATDACALYFSNELLIYAADAWGQPRAPALRIAGDDLRALYEACGPETRLVVLPLHWNEDSGNGER